MSDEPKHDDGAPPDQDQPERDTTQTPPDDQKPREPDQGPPADEQPSQPPQPDQQPQEGDDEKSPPPHEHEPDEEQVEEETKDDDGQEAAEQEAEGKHAEQQEQEHDDKQAEEGDEEEEVTQEREEQEEEQDEEQEKQEEGEEKEEEAKELEEKEEEDKEEDEEEKGEGEAEEGEEEEEEGKGEEGPAAPRVLYDGLDSGLAWLGAEPWVAPAPGGYLPPPPEAAPRAEGAAAAKPLSERRLGVRERLEALRKQAEAEKKWYQKIPLPLWSMAPILVVLVVMTILYPPWGAVGDPSEPCDKALLTAAPLADPTMGLAAMGVMAAEPLGRWEPLPGKVLRMSSAASEARVALAPPADGKNFEATCDVCILEGEEYGTYRIAFLLDAQRGVALIGNEIPKKRSGAGEAQRADYYAAHWRKGSAIYGRRQQTVLKPRYWYQLSIRVRDGAAHYRINGTRIGKAAAPDQAAPANPVLKVINARVLLRNLAVTSPD